MIKRTTERRLDAVNAHMNTAPMNEASVNVAYERFLETGALPDQRRCAWVVLERALRARRGCRPARRRAGILVPPREQVFREAVHDFEPARKAARLLLDGLAHAGNDPSDPEFVPSDCELPDFGTAALHCLGWPDGWVREPYEGQMGRVMKQHAELRESGERSTVWFQAAGRALAAFLREGQVPADDDLQMFVLTAGELFALHADYCGRGDADLIAAFEKVATSSGKKRNEALAHLGQLQVRATEALR